MKISKSFKKSEVVIYAIALMLVVAGYFNYTTNVENVATGSYSENIAEIDQNKTKDVKKKEDKEKEDEDIGDAKLVNSEVQKDNNENKDVKKVDISKDIQNSEEKTKNTEGKTESSKIPNSEEKSNDNDYFASTKLERETNYATAISNYTKIMEDSHISNTEKAIAMKEITKINNTKNAISVCENIIGTKGFEKVIVLVNDKSVNVVVKSQGLNAKSVAQIQNIISRELGTDIANIHITENAK